MQKTVLVPVFLFFFLCVSLPALSEDRLIVKHCEPINLRSSEGWWVSIYDDGSGAYGFGAGLARIKVVKNTFSYKIVYSIFEKARNHAMDNKQQPYMGVSCITETDGFAVEHPIAQDQKLLTTLFQLARKNAHPPMNKFEARSHYHVESFFGGSSWNVTSNILLNKVNSIDVITLN